MWLDLLLCNRPDGFDVYFCYVIKSVLLRENISKNSFNRLYALSSNCFLVIAPFITYPIYDVGNFKYLFKLNEKEMPLRLNNIAKRLLLDYFFQYSLRLLFVSSIELSLENNCSISLARYDLAKFII